MFVIYWFKSNLIFQVRRGRPRDQMCNAGGVMMVLVVTDRLKTSITMPVKSHGENKRSFIN